MASTRITIPGVLGVVTMMGVDIVYALVTPCSLTLPAEFHAVPLTLAGCSFGMQTGGLILSVAGGVVGFVFGWAITRGLIGHR